MIEIQRPLLKSICLSLSRVTLDTNWIQTFQELGELNNEWHYWLFGCNIQGGSALQKTAQFMGDKSANKLKSSL